MLFTEHCQIAWYFIAQQVNRLQLFIIAVILRFLMRQLLMREINKSEVLKVKYPMDDFSTQSFFTKLGRMMYHEE